MEKLTEEQKKLVVENQGIAYEQAGRWQNKCPLDYDELCCMFLEALTKSARTYDSNRKAKFVTYAWTGIKHTIYRWLRDQQADKRRGTCLPFSELMFVDDEGHESPNYELQEKLIQDSPEQFVVDVMEMLEFIDTLSDRRKKILWYYAVKDLDQKEIADIIGISQVSISRNLKTIRSKGQEFLEG